MPIRRCVACYVRELVKPDFCLIRIKHDMDMQINDMTIESHRTLLRSVVIFIIVFLSRRMVSCLIELECCSYQNTTRT